MFESVTTALIYNDELIVELLFIMVLPLTINELLIEVLLFNIVIPETYNELSIVVLFNISTMTFCQDILTKCQFYLFGIILYIYRYKDKQ